MKKLVALLFTSLFILGACSEEEAAQQPIPEGKQEEPELSQEQEELNANLKQEAHEITFDHSTNERYPEGYPVTVTGKISSIEPSGISGHNFKLVTEEDEEYGVYFIVNLNTVEIPLYESQTVTVYGTFAGVGNSNLPELVVSLIE